MHCLFSLNDRTVGSVLNYNDVRYTENWITLQAQVQMFRANNPLSADAVVDSIIWLAPGLLKWQRQSNTSLDITKKLTKNHVD